MPAAINPRQATEISDASRDTALLIAEAIPLRAGSTDDKATEVSGVMVTTRPADSKNIPGSNSVMTLNSPPDGPISKSPTPANAGPLTRKSQGPLRPSKLPTRRANRNDMIGMGKVAKPAAMAE